MKVFQILKQKINIVLLITSLSVLGMFNSTRAASEQPLNVFTVNYPLKYFAQQIAGPYARVTLPMPKDIDPAFWLPNSESIIEFQNADLILLNGANYAKWIAKVSLPQFSQVNTSSLFKEAYIDIKSATTHNHGLGGEHSHTGTAFTTWLDFSQAAQQAEAVYVAISNKRPELKEKLHSNFAELQSSLLSLDAQLSESTSKNLDIAIIGSHPVYQYLTRRYGLNLRSVHWEPDQLPNSKQWEELKSILQSHPAKWMLWEGTPNPETVSKLENLGMKSVVFSPCANEPESGDFFSVMQKNIANFKQIFQKP